MNLFLFPLLPLADVAPGPAQDGTGALLVWAGHFAVTLAIELPAVALMWRLRGGPGQLRTWLLAGLIGNAISHPTATAVWWALGLWTGSVAAITAYIVLECGVVAFETWVFRRRATRDTTEALIMATAANLFTALLGFYAVFLV